MTSVSLDAVKAAQVLRPTGSNYNLRLIDRVDGLLDKLTKWKDVNDECELRAFFFTLVF